MQNTLPKTLPAFAWYFLKKQWKWLVIIQIFSFAWSLDHTIWPYIIMVLVDTINAFDGDRAHAWQALTTPILMGLGLWLTVEFSFRISGILMARVIPKLEADVRLAMFKYVEYHSHLYFSDKMSGAISNKISDMPQSLTYILLNIVQVFLPVILALVISTFFFAKINPLFALILVGWVLVHMSICWAFSRKCADYSHIHAEARTTLSGKIVDSLTNISTIKLFARPKFEYEYVKRFQDSEKKKHYESLIYIEKMKFFLGIATFLGAGIALNWFMLDSWVKGKITAGEVVLIFNTTWNITMMAWLAGLELPQMFREIGICKQALTIIQDSHDIIDDPNAVPLKVNKGEIEFNDVTFSYRPGFNLFENKNIIIHAGEKVGLVGFSGSGKTTFLNLILRYYDIEKGQILIDGQDIAKVSQESLREQIAVIPQEPSLFHRTIMENIRYGRLDATDEEVIEASKHAHCHEFIIKTPEKYQALVGERGLKLSGGQRQRIAIARALLKNAPILVLDEATSALDSLTEKDIQDGLDLLMANHTTIVIAHRLSTLSGMDRILVFNEGKIVEDGSHEELIKQNEHYARMWAMQAGGFLPEEEETEEESDSYS
jgi:ATP-binding cassette subfamily B protein